MNRFIIAINRLHGGKNVKIFYFIAQLIRWTTPRSILHRRLGAVLRRGERRYDMTYIMDRVDYYNLMSDVHVLGDDAKPLSECKLSNTRSAYFFDTYQTTRWFDDSLLWHSFFGDGVFDLPHPTLIKVRSVEGGGRENSILLNMDRARFDIWLHDRKPFVEKLDKVIFRGSVKNSPQRICFMEAFGNHPCVDTADTRSGHSDQEKGTARQISLYDHLDYKFIMSLEGNDIASNTRWIMSTNSIVVMPRPRRESWFMEGRLIPDYHYIEVKPDFSDLEAKIEHYIAHPELGQAIVDHANEYVRQFQDSRRERFISLLVVKKYFDKTGQNPLKQ